MPEQNSKKYSERQPAKISNRLLISVGVGLGVFIAVSFYGDFKEVSRELFHFNFYYIPVILAFSLCNYLLRFCKWNYYLRAIKVRIPLMDSLLVFFSGLAMSVTPAKVGEFFKSFLLNKLNNTEISRTVSVVIAERITDALSMVVLCALSLLYIQYENKVLIGIIAVVLVGFIILIQSRKAVDKLIDVFSHIPILKKISEDIRLAYATCYVLFRFKNLIFALCIGVFSWGFECVSLYFVIKGFGTNILVFTSIFIFSLSSLVGAVSMIPGGLIVTEGSIIGLLIWTGISRQIAASATVVSRIATLWFGVILGIIATYIVVRKCNRPIPEQSDRC